MRTPEEIVAELIPGRSQDRKIEVAEEVIAVGSGGRRMTEQERTLSDQVADVVLECGQELKYWDLDGGQRARAVWTANDTVRLDPADGGPSGPEFVVRVVAHRSDEPRLDLTPDPRVAMLVADLVRAALVWRKQLGQIFDTGELAQAVDALSAALTPPAETRWVASTWAKVRAGDRIRVPAGDGYAEADVESALDLKWIGSGTHQVKIKLTGRDQVYTMPASGVVEVRDLMPAMAEALRILRQSFPEVKHIGEVKS